MGKLDQIEGIENPDQVLLMLAVQADGQLAGQFIIEKAVGDGDEIRTAHSVVVKTHDGDALFSDLAEIVGELNPVQLNVALVDDEKVIAIVTSPNQTPPGEEPDVYIGEMTIEDLSGRLDYVMAEAMSHGQEFQHFLEEVDDPVGSPSLLNSLASAGTYHKLSDLEEIEN